MGQVSLNFKVNVGDGVAEIKKLETHIQKLTGFNIEIQGLEKVAGVGKDVAASTEKIGTHLRYAILSGSELAKQFMNSTAAIKKTLEVLEKQGEVAQKGRHKERELLSNISTALKHVSKNTKDLNDGLEKAVAAFGALKQHITETVGPESQIAIIAGRIHEAISASSTQAGIFAKEQKEVATQANNALLAIQKQGETADKTNETQKTTIDQIVSGINKIAGSTSGLNESIKNIAGAFDRLGERIEGIVPSIREFAKEQRGIRVEAHNIAREGIIAKSAAEKAAEKEKEKREELKKQTEELIRQKRIKENSFYSFYMEELYDFVNKRRDNLDFTPEERRSGVFLAGEGVGLSQAEIERDIANAIKEKIALREKEFSYTSQAQSIEKKRAEEEKKRLAEEISANKELEKQRKDAQRAEERQKERAQKELEKQRKEEERAEKAQKERAQRESERQKKEEERAEKAQKTKAQREKDEAEALRKKTQLYSDIKRLNEEDAKVVIDSIGRERYSLAISEMARVSKEETLKANEKILRATIRNAAEEKLVEQRKAEREKERQERETQKAEARQKANEQREKDEAEALRKKTQLHSDIKRLNEEDAKTVIASIGSERYSLAILEKERLYKEETLKVSEKGLRATIRNTIEKKEQTSEEQKITTEIEKQTKRSEELQRINQSLSNAREFGCEVLTRENASLEDQKAQLMLLTERNNQMERLSRETAANMARIPNGAREGANQMSIMERVGRRFIGALQYMGQRITSSLVGGVASFVNQWVGVQGAINVVNKEMEKYLEYVQKGRDIRETEREKGGIIASKVYDNEARKGLESYRTKLILSGKVTKDEAYELVDVMAQSGVKTSEMDDIVPLIQARSLEVSEMRQSMIDAQYISKMTGKSLKEVLGMGIRVSANNPSQVSPTMQAVRRILNIANGKLNTEDVFAAAGALTTRMSDKDSAVAFNQMLSQIFSDPETEADLAEKIGMKIETDANGKRRVVDKRWNKDTMTENIIAALTSMNVNGDSVMEFFSNIRSKRGAVALSDSDMEAFTDFYKIVSQLKSKEWKNPYESAKERVSKDENIIVETERRKIEAATAMQAEGRSGLIDLNFNRFNEEYRKSHSGMAGTKQAVKEWATNYTTTDEELLQWVIKDIVEGKDGSSIEERKNKFRAAISLYTKSKTAKGEPNIGAAQIKSIIGQMALQNSMLGGTTYSIDDWLKTDSGFSKIFNETVATASGSTNTKIGANWDNYLKEEEKKRKEVYKSTAEDTIERVEGSIRYAEIQKANKQRKEFGLDELDTIEEMFTGSKSNAKVDKEKEKADAIELAKRKKDATEDKKTLKELSEGFFVNKNSSREQIIAPIAGMIEGTKDSEDLETIVNNEAFKQINVGRKLSAFRMNNTTVKNALSNFDPTAHNVMQSGLVLFADDKTNADVDKGIAAKTAKSLYEEYGSKEDAFQAIQSFAWGVSRLNSLNESDRAATKEFFRAVTGFLKSIDDGIQENPAFEEFSKTFIKEVKKQQKTRVIKTSGNFAAFGG